MIAQVAFFSFLAGALLYRSIYYFDFKELKESTMQAEDLIDRLKEEAKKQGINTEDL